MKFVVEYKSYVYFDVEADSLEVALDKADALCDEFCERTPEVSYCELTYVNWNDGDGNFGEKEFYL